MQRIGGEICKRLDRFGLVGMLAAGCLWAGCSDTPSGSGDAMFDGAVADMAIDLAVIVEPMDAARPADAGKPAKDAGVGDASLSPAAEVCLLHTIDLPHCKDCCDCAPIGCTELTPCRNACKEHDFTGNKDFVDMQIPTVLGPGGDYSVCVKTNPTAQSCKYCCECLQGLACGDYKYCRTLCDNSYGGLPG